MIVIATVILLFVIIVVVKFCNYNCSTMPVAIYNRVRIDTIGLSEQLRTVVFLIY